MGVDREALQEFLAEVIENGEQEKREREATIEQYKQSGRELLVGKTITDVTHDEHGYLLSVTVGSTELKPTSDYEQDADRHDEEHEHGAGHWLEIWGEGA